MLDTFIVNGKIIDVENEEILERNIGILDGKIKYVGQDNNIECLKVIDAKNKFIAPGFIDIHMHEEVIVNDNYDIANYMLNMGVTTALGGNCGDNYQRIADMFEYIDNNGSPINYLMLSGYTTLRNLVGANDRYEAATAEQRLKLKKLIKEDIEAGARGISFGIEYAPGITTEEIIDVVSDVNDDLLITAHYRSDGQNAKNALNELIEIAKKTNKPMQISHLGSCSAFGYMEQSLEIIDKAIIDGVDLSVDCYPYNAFSTKIGTSVFDEGCFENWGAEYSDILLTEDPYKNIRCTKELFEKVREEYPEMLVVAFVMNEEEVIEAIKNPNVMIASDGLYNNGQGHPRGAGTFPKVISKYARDKNELSLVEAIKKMTIMPAKRLGMVSKGIIDVGMDADIVIFDYDKIDDQATFKEPTLSPTGIEYVIIAGKIALENCNVINNSLGQTYRYPFK